jgi:hypothetical protein
MKPIQTYYFKDRVAQIWPSAHLCRCKTMHVMFYNVGGVTYCPNCIKEEHDSAANN